MSITDELRTVAAKTECANGRCEKLYRGDLDRIADRIDAAVDGMIELPKDADGEYICAGDVLDGYGKTIEVVEMRYGRGGWVLISRDGGRYAQKCANAYRHHRPDTFERILSDALGCEPDDLARDPELAALVDRCKALAGGAE